MVFDVNKYIFGFLLIIVVLGGWKYTKLAEENGGLKKDKANLDQSLKESEKNLKQMQEVAAFNATVVSKTEKAKAKLNTYALKKAHELEILKNENIEIKSWADNVVPVLIAGQLYNTAYNENENRLPISANGTTDANTGTSIAIRNEDAYRYAIDSVTALRQCNKDKQGVIEWINNAKEKIE